ncbi:MAG: NAD-dependent epimerase/dehydratase family protein [Patescibacteria group bacterium]|jgi:dTDP-glucose 4,6-dehydratase
MDHKNNKYNSKKDLVSCLVAGGAGFIGSHLCQMLLDQNCHVYCLDNFSSGSKKNINRFTSNSNFTFLEQDINAYINLASDVSLDYVFHVAGAEICMNGVRHALETLLANSFGTKNLLELAKQHAAKFLLASSELIHDQLHLGYNFSDFMNTSGEGAVFGDYLEAKRFSETLTVEYAEQKSLDARIVRLAFVYGPEMSPASGNLIGGVLREILTRGSIALPNDGMTPIFPTYITDVAYGLVKAMFSQSSKGKIYGLVNPQATTLLHAVYQVRDILQEDIKINFKPTDGLPPSPVVTQQIIKSQEALGWYPRTKFEDGLERTIDYFKSIGIKHDKKFSSHMTSQGVENQISETGGNVSVGYDKRIDYMLPPLRHSQTNLMYVLKKKGGVNNLPTTKKIETKVDASQTITPILKSRRTHRKRWSGKKRIMKKITILALLVVMTSLVLFGPYLLLTLLTIRGNKLLMEVKEVLIGERVGQTTTMVNQMRKELRLANAVYKFVKLEQDIVAFPLPSSTLTYLAYGDKVGTILYNLELAQENMAHIINIAFNKETADPQEHLQSALSNLSQANEAISFIRAETSSEGVFSSLGIDLESLQLQVNSGLRLIPIISDLLAFQDKKTLLILLQDSHELRSTGGFIEGLAIVTVEKGRVLDIQTMDALAADALLKGVVSPPEELEKYLGEKNWWFRDSNFSPNFPTSAARAAWFLHKELGVVPDGVVALNSYLFMRVLGATDEVFLPEFNDSISRENILERSQRYANMNLLNEGEDHSKNFYVTLTKHLFEKVQTLSQKNWLKLGLALHDSLERREMLVWLPDSASEIAINEMGWDGMLRASPQQLVEFGLLDVRDYLGIFENNYGVNKVNYYVDRQYDHQVTISPKGEISVSSNLVLTNSSATEAWPGGRYKNYVRFFLPQFSHLNSVRIGKDPLRIPEEEIQKDDLIKGVEEDYRYIGFYIEVPPQSQRVVQVNYKLSDILPVKQDSCSYVLYMQKQSGTKDSPYRVTFNYPGFLKPSKMTQHGKMEGNTLVFTGTFDKDKVFAVSFLR